jgi:hypothetical protein
MAQVGARRGPARGRPGAALFGHSTPTWVACLARLPRLQKTGARSSWDIVRDIARSVGWPVSMGALPLFRLKNSFLYPLKTFAKLGHHRRRRDPGC